MNLKVPQANDIQNKTVLIRADFNVPINNGMVTDDTKIKNALETINFCLENKAKKIILCSHLGRPKGKPNPKFSLAPVAKQLSKLLKQEVFLKTIDSRRSLSRATTRDRNDNSNQKIILLENLRFDKGEKKNDPQFAKQLASLADVYINEAFASSHRKHASVVGVTKYLPSVAGFNLSYEAKHLEKLLENPKRPFVVIVGGAKISDKLTAIENLSHIADTILVGGGVANNFLKAENYEVYNSYMEDSPADLKKEGLDFVKFADNLLDSNRQESSLVDGFPIPKILYPIDVLAANSPESKTSKHIELVEQNFRNYKLDLPAGEAGIRNSNLMYLDIGPKTIKLYSQIIKQAKTIFWNGPMGVFENPVFASGSKQIAKAIANSNAYSVIGGGETIKTVDQFGLQAKYSYVSAAGGAALEFLSGKTLPGLEPLLIK